VYQNRKGKAEKATFTMVSDDYKQIHNITTDLSGRFSLKDVAFYDSTRFAIQLESGKVTWNKKDGPDLPVKMPKQGIPVIKVASPFSSNAYEAENSTVLLKEVIVKSNKEEVHFENRYGKPDISVNADVLSAASPNLASAIQQKIPGFKLIYQSTHWFLVRERGEFTIGAAAEPLLFIDNVQANTSNETTGDRLYAMSTSQVDHIEVTGMINANVGANGSHGLIAVFTKKTSAAVSKELQIVKLKGFDRVKQFTGPDYALTADGKGEDKRSTLYWNPIVNVNALSKEQLSFFTSDLTGTFRIIIEGVTGRGAPVRSEAVITVEE
ncbi:MAG TPA: hypothetical protein VK666_02145, partial [Chryseolinea sp.]|nr:hypothetical protein [Chryseolinea sp.]